MAIIINPDGTVSSIETTHDQYGNLKPKIDSDTMLEQEIHYNKNTVSGSSKKGYVYPTSSDAAESKAKNSEPDSIEQKDYITTYQVNRYFNKLLTSGKLLSPKQFQSIKDRIPKYLHDYFDAKYESYIEKIKKSVETFKRKKSDKPKAKKIKKEKKPLTVKEAVAHHNSHSGHTIGDIAKFSSLKENYASSQDFDVRTSNPPRPARAPKYAYARDRYGRVQERDSFNEEKKNEFYTAQNRQKNYDYSSYDANDDNDGAYSNWE